MAGDDELHTELAPEAIGQPTKCPRCLRWGKIDDVHEGDVIIRHDAVTWHVSPAAEASAIQWERHLPRSDRAAAQTPLRGRSPRG